jgi:chemotaxis protein methyltransferase CheR
MKSKDIEKLEMSLLTDGIYQAYGYDFRHYAMASFQRRIEQFRKNNNYESITHLLAASLHSKEVFSDLVNSISVTTSEMFRDPSVFKYLREKVIPYLKTFPHIRIWHAACANGEEVISLAILLKEEGVYDRCSIYATDFNENALKNAQKGIFSVKALKEYSQNYLKSGGKATLSDYYHAKYDHVMFDKSLLKNVTFSNHNLVVDSVFIEPQLILCRNAMIYFNRELQDRVLNLFNESLASGGVLCIGSKETLQFSTIDEYYSCLQKNYKIYRKDVNASQ